eukprot:scaffold14.g1219.t1
MADGSNFLVVSPLELRFRFELRKNIPVTLTLQNVTGERVAFKVKTTSPKKYCVRPSNGFVEPNGTRDVQVIMQAQKEYPPSFADCKDKFLIQSVKVGAAADVGAAPGRGARGMVESARGTQSGCGAADLRAGPYCAVRGQHPRPALACWGLAMQVGADAKEVTADLFDPTKVKDIRQIKLRVQLQGPPKPPSPVPEGVEEPLSPGGVTQYRDTQAAADKAEINRRLGSLEAHSKGGAVAAGGAAAAAAPPPAGGFGLLHLLLVALLAFVIGHVANVALPFITSRLQGGKGAGTRPG